MCTVCNSLMICGVLVPPMNAHGYSVGYSLVLGNIPLRCAFAHLPNEFVFFIQQESVFQNSMMKCLYLYSIMIALLRVTAGESMIPRPCFQISNRRLFTVLLHVYLLPVLLQIVITAHIHTYHLRFNISSPN